MALLAHGVWRREVSVGKNEASPRRQASSVTGSRSPFTLALDRAGSLRRCHHLCLLHLAGAELELRDLAHAVQLRVGQQVGGSLGEAERDEPHPSAHVAIGARLQPPLAAPRRYANVAARLDAEPFHVAWVETGDGLRLQGIEVGGT